MLPDIEKIKKVRKKLGLTQKELAKLAGCSQSAVAKIESRVIVPNYQLVKDIFEVFEGIHSEDEKKAKDIMTKKILYVNKTDSLKTTVKKMKKYAISQFPVKMGNDVVGHISEKTIIEKGLFDISKLKVGDVMAEKFPEVSSNSSITLCMEVLKENPAVLVFEKGKVKGIITKTDIINHSG